MRYSVFTLLVGLLLASRASSASLRSSRRRNTLLPRANSTSTLPTVTLDYSTVQAYETGTTTAGKYYVFKNIRYAQSPVGSLRWAAPQNPLVETTINNGTVDSEGTQGCSVAEDCLFVDVWAPASAIEGRASLPVLFWNYGGGWTGGSKNENTPEGLFEQSSNGIVFVAYNYRLGIFGVLNGPTLQTSGGVSNVAVYDARKAMEWTHTYISKFGGNPDQITNWGFSAGGSQVAVALTAFGGNKWTPLFKRAIINSPGWVPGGGNEHADRYLANVTSLVGGCPINTAETIECLRQVDFDTLLTASENITSTYDYQMQPRVDSVVLPGTAEYLFNIRKNHPQVELLIGHSAHESNSQANSAVSDDASYRAEFKVIFPSITDWTIDQIEELYPASNYSSQGLRFAAATQHYDLVAKILPATHAYRNRTFNYINNLGTATHGSDQAYWWYYADSTSTSTSATSNSASSASSGSTGTMTGSAPSGSQSSQSSSASSTASNTTSSSGAPSGGAGGGGGGMSSSLSGNETAIAVQMQRYLLSFVITGNPNSLASVNSTAVITEISSWPRYGGNPDHVVEFNTTGFSVTHYDELDNNQVRFWNKALWY
ncbi:alpha/beta-hydrolase [Meredithblackwellia eburnea MCA 4105]